MLPSGLPNVVIERHPFKRIRENHVEEEVESNSTKEHKVCNESPKLKEKKKNRKNGTL